MRDEHGNEVQSDGLCWTKHRNTGRSLEDRLRRKILREKGHGNTAKEDSEWGDRLEDGTLKYVAGYSWHWCEMRCRKRSRASAT